MPSTMRLGGVAAVLEEVRDRVHREMVARLRARRSSGYLDVSDEAIESTARVAASIARTACADGIATAYQLGVDRAVTREQHDVITAKVKVSTHE
jgi:hypothetical protein